MHWLRRLAGRLAWLAAAAGIALGSAGLAGGMDHPAGAGGRGELTLAADAAITPGLDAATEDLATLAEDVGAVGDLGRSALTALVARRTADVEAAVAAGREKIAAIKADAAALRARLETLPGVGPGMTGRLGAEALARHAILVEALPGLDDLEDAWLRLTTGAAPATDLTRRLLAHDEIAGAAVKFGSSGKYGEALEQLAKAEAELAAAASIRDRLAATVDVETLDEWMKRNTAYDRAVRSLWQAMVDSGGRVTDKVRAAAARAETARQALPADARALVVILGDVARGGLNQAVVEVERVRGPLGDAAAASALVGKPGSSPEPAPAQDPAGASVEP